MWKSLLVAAAVLSLSAGAALVEDARAQNVIKEAVETAGDVAEGAVNAAGEVAKGAAEVAGEAVEGAGKVAGTAVETTGKTVECVADAAAGKTCPKD